MIQFASPLVLSGLLAAGAAVGFVSALFGIGGGTVYVPVVYALLTADGTGADAAMKCAIGTSLFVMSFMSAAAGWGHYRAGNLVARAVAPIAAGSAIGAVAGAFAAARIDGTVFRQAFGAVLLIIAARLFTKRVAAEAESPRGGAGTFFLIGLATGVFSSMLGVGGGVVVVSAMTMLLGHGMRNAIGTSSIVIVLTSAVGAAAHAWAGREAPGLPAHSVGYVHALYSAALIPTSMAAARAGARFTARVDAGRLRAGFSVFLVPVGLKMLGVF